MAKKKRVRRNIKAVNPVIALRDALPFFAPGTRGQKGSWWSVTPTGDYGADYNTGRQFAAATLPLMRYTAGPSSLSMVLGDMFDAISNRRAGQYGGYDKLSGIEIGFRRGLGDLVVAGLVVVGWLTAPRVNPSRARSRSISP